MRVLHVSESDGGGGASRAAFRIHQALVGVEHSSGVVSHMLVRKSCEDDLRIAEIQPSRASRAVNKLAKRVATVERKLLKTGNRIIHSTARMPTPALRQIRKIDPDAVVLHWLGNNVLSIEQVGALVQSGVPVFWVLHDTWAFCGAEHYSHGEGDRRFVQGYRRENRPSWESGLDVNRHTWDRKRRHWTHPIHLIAPSHWIAGLARTSALARSWSTEVVPNPVDTRWWGASSREQARHELGIPPSRRVVLYGAMGGEKDPRKGADLLRAALTRFSQDLSEEERQNLDVLTFGGKEGTSRVADLTVRSVGRLDDEGLRRYYSAADVAVVPSRMDNLPQTAVEPIACGTPVVAFRIGGLPDIVTDGVTGRLVEPFFTEAMSEAIGWVLADDERRKALSRRARESAEKWNAESVGERLADVLARAREN